MPAEVAAKSRMGLAIGLVLFATFAFTVMDGIAKLVAARVPVPQILWVRYLAFLVIAVLLARRKDVSLQSRRPWLQATSAALLVCESGLVIGAFMLLPLADVHGLMASAPLMVIGLSVAVLGERIEWQRQAAVLVGFVGVLVMVRPGFADTEAAMMLALMAAAMWALYQLTVGILARVDAAETTAVWTAAVGFAMLSIVPLLPARLDAAAWVVPDGATVLLLLAIGVLGGVAQTAMITALSLTEASRLQPFNYTQFVWAIPIGAVLFGDWPGWTTLIGATLIIAAGIYTWRRSAAH